MPSKVRQVGRFASALKIEQITDKCSDFGPIKFYKLATAVTSTVTAVPDGTVAGLPAAADYDIAMTSHATGRGLLFYALSGVWNVLTGTSAQPVKATGAEMNTGTDDAKYLTSKAAVDADAAKVAGTPTTGDYFYYRTAAGVPKKILFTDLATLINV